MTQHDDPTPPRKPARPQPPAGPFLGRPAGAPRGFIPPTVHRQKVEVARSHDTPVPPPVVHEAEVLPISQPAISHSVDPQAAAAPAGPRPPRRPLLRYYGGGAIGGVLLLLSAITAGFWLHSFGAIDRAIHATTAGRYYWVESSRGAIYCHIELDPNPVERELDVWRFEFGDPWAKKDPPPTIAGAPFLGVMVVHVPVPGLAAKVPYLVISYWLAVLVLAVPGLWWLLNRRRLRLLCHGQRCLGCGYDLRNTPHRCPECGLPGNTNDFRCGKRPKRG